MFITYDLPQDSKTQEGQSIQRGAKEVSLPGKVTGWQIGEFETPSGKKVPGVQFTFGIVGDDTGFEVVELPANAQNVQVHEKRLPAEYREALKTAA